MPTLLMLADGASIHTARWANAIARRGWHVHVFTLRDPAHPLDERVIVHRAHWKAPAGYLANVPQVRRVLAGIRPDVVHAHYASGYGTLAALAGCRPLITSVWGADIYDFPGKSRFHAAVIRHNLARCDAVLSTSHVMADQARKFTRKAVGVTPFGIDLDQFRPMTVAASLFAAGDIVIGTVKSLAPKYGIEYLVHAFALVKQRRPRLPLKLMIVGGGPQEHQLKNLAAALNVGSDSVFTGQVPHDLVPQYHNMLSISVSVSTLDSESFGVAVLEASACEKPVVVSSVGGLPEVVEEGITGFVVPPRDPVRTADAIEKLVVDEALRSSMGKAGRERVRTLYEWDRCVDAMVDHYDRVSRRLGPSS